MMICLALVVNDSQLCVVDADGAVCSYSCHGGGGHPGLLLPQLCFSSHGQAVDDFLTPCLDEEGRHGSPDKGCFCGQVEPHIHAHVYDSTTCHDPNSSTTTCGSHSPNASSSKSHHDSLMRLAQVTLLPETTTQEIHISHPTNFRVDCNSSCLQEVIEEHHQTRLLFSVLHDDHVDALVQR
jgi:hypothetical protein